MKTVFELHEQLDRIEQIWKRAKRYTEWYELDIEFLDRWARRLNRIRLNVLMDWGKELCEEQKIKCISKYSANIGMSPNQIKQALKKSFLPDILTQ